MIAEKLPKIILSKIKKENIKPKPRLYFLLKNILFWIIFAASAILGARAVGVIIFIVFKSDFGFLMRAPGPIFMPLLRIFPFFWVIFFLLFLLFAAAGLHQTKKGYKLSTVQLVGINILLSLVIGIVSYVIGDAENFENTFRHRAFFYTGIEERIADFWSNSEQGRLAGTIIEAQDNQTLLLDDFSKKRWVVDYSGSKERGRIRLEPGEEIRLTGKVVSESGFKAEILAPWHMPEPFFREPPADRFLPPPFPPTPLAESSPPSSSSPPLPSSLTFPPLPPPPPPPHF